jgi:hypothetical protein
MTCPGVARNLAPRDYEVASSCKRHYRLCGVSKLGDGEGRHFSVRSTWFLFTNPR